jgi:excisionase family DNA binding protein
MAKISIASRRKKVHQPLPQSFQPLPQSAVHKTVVIPQNAQMETDMNVELTNEGIAQFLSALNQALSQQEQMQFMVILTRAEANKIKIEVNSQSNGNGNGNGMRILKSDEVCDMLKITKRVLHRCAKHGIIPGLKIGREWRFEADRILQLLKEI